MELQIEEIVENDESSIRRVILRFTMKEENQMPVRLRGWTLAVDGV